MKTLTFVAALLVVSPLAFAQSRRNSEVRILIYGADTVAQCAAPVKALQTELRTMRFPDGWTIGIICNQLAWRQILNIANPPPTTTAFSNLIRRSTVLNSAIFSLPRHTYRHTLAHELGHVTCKCADENRAEEFALRQDGLDRVMAQAHPVQETAGH